MKKLTFIQKNVSLRIAISKHLKSLKRRNKRYNPYKLKHAPISLNSKNKMETYDIEVPQNFDIDKNYNESISLIDDFAARGLKTKQPLKLNFSNCTSIAPAAMLLLLAHIDRIRILRGSDAVTGTYPLDEKLDKKMCAMGFYDLLNIKNRYSHPKTFPMEYIKFVSGTKKPDRFTQDFKSSLFGNLSIKTDVGRSFYAAITEALLNCLNHAYPDTPIKDKKIKNKWWLSGHYHKPSGNLHIMFCDLGVGIPETLPRTQTSEKIRDLIKKLSLGMYEDDGTMIRAAMAIGRSQTGHNNRGKGLNDLRKLIEKIGAGKLIVYSNKGRYNFNLKDEKFIEESHKTLSYSIRGTLIHWTVPIDKVVENWSA